MEGKKKGQRKKSTKSQKVVSIKSHRRSQQAKKEAVRIETEIQIDRIRKVSQQLGLGGESPVRHFDDFSADDLPPIRPIAQHVLEKLAKEHPKEEWTNEMARRAMSGEWKGELVKDLATGKIELNLILILSTWMPFAYEHHCPRHGKYAKDKVIEKATETLLEMTRKLLEYVDRIPVQVIFEPWFLAIYGGKARRPLDKLFKTKLKSGRKPADRGAVIQEAKKLYDELLKILTPGFDSGGAFEKWKLCEELVSGLQKQLHLRYQFDVEKLVGKVFAFRNSRRAAQFLIAKMFQKSERQIQRYLFGK